MNWAIEARRQLHLIPEAGYEEAISEALGGSMYNIVTVNEQCARDAIAFLTRNLLSLGPPPHVWGKWMSLWDGGLLSLPLGSAEDPRAPETSLCWSFSADLVPVGGVCSNQG